MNRRVLYELHINLDKAEKIIIPPAHITPYEVILHYIDYIIRSFFLKTEKQDFMEIWSYFESSFKEICVIGGILI